MTEQPAQAGTPAGTETETAVPETEAGTQGEASGSEEKAEPSSATADLTVGTEIGNLLPDFTTELLSGETFRLSDFRGRVVIINFWGTTCAPCVAELPYYEQLKVQYPDVEILAIHNRAGPQTIILDRQGVVVYNAQAPLTYEKLEVLYRQALEH